jgi:thiol-disulfide isomerase/thioredoxin
MRALQRVTVAGVLWLVAGGIAQAEGEMRWEPTLDAAKRLAAQTNRFVLVHFWAPWCKPCLRLDQEVYQRPTLGEELSTSFVAVKLNADNFPATARQFGVTSLPMDVILSPSGQPVARLSCPPDYAQYVGQLRQIAANAGGRVDSPYAELNVPATVAPAPAVPQARGLATASPSTAVDPANPYAHVFQNQPAPGAAPTAPAPPASSAVRVSAATAPRIQVTDPAMGPSGPPPTGGAPAPASVRSNPPLGLDGFCPVELAEHRRWVKGDPQWGAIHRDRTYLFAGPEQQQRFLANGDAYSPVMSGIDPVAMVDHNQAVPGKREFGVFFNQRVYLFADASSRERFTRSPERYTVESLQARSLPPGVPLSR